MEKAKRHKAIHASLSRHIPAVGFGTYKLADDECVKACSEAIKQGYRLLDTAQIYGNEKFVGQAVRDSGLQDEVMVTTKVWRSSHGYERTMKSVKKSLRAMKLEHIDLVLVHWPGPKTGWPLKKGTVCPPDWTTEMRVTGTWRALEECVKNGIVKHLGVANYGTRHLKQLLASCKVAPIVNQVEFHPLLVQTELVEFCKENNIAVQAFASLGSAENKKGHDEVMKLPAVVAVAKAHSRSVAQVLLRWALQKGIHVIPKSSVTERISENFQVFNFELSKKEVEAIDACNEDRRLTWKSVDPSTIE